MGWHSVAFSSGISISVSVTVTAFLFTWLRSDIRELRELFIKYIAKDNED